MSGAALIRADSLAIPLASRSVWLSISSPPYFALRSYQDGGEHYAGQIGSEPSPTDFLRALWRVYDEVYRVLRDDGSCFVNLGDKYAGSGGHNNSNISATSALREPSGYQPRRCETCGTETARMRCNGCGGKVVQPRVAQMPPAERNATRRSAPDRYNQASDVLAKSLMGLPWRFAMGLIDPRTYRDPIDPPDGCWHDERPCTACRSGWPQWILRAEFVWSKPNGMPESVGDRVRRSHEQWFHFTKAGRYYSALDEIREPHAEWTLRAYELEAAAIEKLSAPVANPLGRVPGSVLTLDDEPLSIPPEVLATLTGEDSATVWSVATEPLQVPSRLDVDHFAAYPQEWPRRFILGWSPSGVCTACGEGRRPVTSRVFHGEHNDAEAQRQRTRAAMSGGVDAVRTIIGTACACETPNAPTTPAVVCDPFGGTGTTAMVARALGRFGVHLDLSADYLRLANWRVFESGHARKAVAKTNVERKATGAKPAEMPHADDSLFGAL